MKIGLGMAAIVTVVGLASASAADFGVLAVSGASLKLQAMEGSDAPAVSASRAVGNNVRAKGVEWVSIPGGTFTMGVADLINSFGVIHRVTLKPFKMSKTVVTVAQYAECVAKGKCTEPNTGGLCNWNVPGRGEHPVNCVSWWQARDYADFAGARLPSESEWEYAARSGGKDVKYPWGNNSPTKTLAVFREDHTRPVCSRPAGNTAQGLCDMSGNVWQWMQDHYDNYDTAVPADGSAYYGSGGLTRVSRGGSFFEEDARYLRTDYRGYNDSLQRYSHFGFRLAK